MGLTPNNYHVAQGVNEITFTRLKVKYESGKYLKSPRQQLLRIV